MVECLFGDSILIAFLGYGLVVIVFEFSSPILLAQEGVTMLVGKGGCCRPWPLG